MTSGHFLCTSRSGGYITGAAPGAVDCLDCGEITILVWFGGGGVLKASDHVPVGRIHVPRRDVRAVISLNL